MTDSLRRLLPAILLALSTGALAEQPADADGFTRPLEQLKFNPQLNQREFERATLVALVNNDPWEEWNRRIYHFNQRFDEWVYLPVVNGYRFVTPRFVRSGVSHFFANLGEVPSLANHLLQLQGKDAMTTTARLLFNTTLGIGGLWDPASRMGLERRSEDFGQTLGYWGAEEGPYLVLPLLGPSNLRDTGGLVFDTALGSAANPAVEAGLTAQGTTYYGLMAIDRRHINDFRYGQLNSPFEYEKVRYVYTEARRLQISE
ncbi:phospholipid-binding lipoprotein MlaA [Geopseudomonas sagittaria]|uniref:Phospholipid-binding lipoprotein MlaA n=1 Tax=Geopseudomonas sagittaria TaxID=1135990 RepID=A0A1I5W4T7_9GAMM|nr:phospholipid-binding lipoprotein MlaA [Pseudomonas sagittaria]